MKKLIFTLTLLCAFTFNAAFAGTHSFLNKSCINDGGKKKELTLGSHRASVNMLLRFNAAKAGSASITILNETGKIVGEQSSPLTKSLNTVVLKNAVALPEGAYTVRLIVNNETHTASFFIFK